MRTVRQNGELVVQRRACRLVKPSDAADGVVRLLRDDDTIVADFQMAQLQRVCPVSNKQNIAQLQRVV